MTESQRDTLQHLRQEQEKLGMTPGEVKTLVTRYLIELQILSDKRHQGSKNPITLLRICHRHHISNFDINKEMEFCKRNGLKSPTKQRIYCELKRVAKRAKVHFDAQEQQISAQAVDNVVDNSQRFLTFEELEDLLMELDGTEASMFVESCYRQMVRTGRLSLRQRRKLCENYTQKGV